MITCFPPAELMFDRTLNTLIPLRRSGPGPAIQHEWLYNKQQGIKTYHDKSSRKIDLSSMFFGQKVIIIDKVNKSWCPATITKKFDQPHSYIVQTPNGNTLSRNRSHHREMYVAHINLIIVLTLPQFHITNYTTHTHPHDMDINIV